MAFSRVYGAQTVLLDGRIINIEIDLSKGLQAFTVVGLPDKAVEESQDRISAAIKNTGFTSPKSKNQKIVISLAPADLKKEGPLFDLPMALSYLLAAKEIRFNPDNKIFIGELSLDGKLRRVKGILPLVLEAKKRGFEEVYLPKENVMEGALVSGIKIYGAETLKEVIDHLNEKRVFEKIPLKYARPTKISNENDDFEILFSDVKGQETAKRGLLIAAAGGHNIAMYGPAGTGKTMLARAFSSILPPLSFDEILEATSIYSVSGDLSKNLVTRPPFRSPHHTSSYVSLVGGGAIPKPGEITLAHKGVLFLDEFPEFDKRVIESLRQPLEDRVVSISRARGRAVFPADFIMIAAMNPCPCGNYGTEKECRCIPISIERYRRKLSGPIVDRIDIWIEVPRIEHKKLLEKSPKNKKVDEGMRMKIKNARRKQQERLKTKKSNLNSEMSARDIEELINLNQKSKEILESSAMKLGLSPRSFHKVIKVARTIADLEEEKEIKEGHILEALQYRPKVEH